MRIVCSGNLIRYPVGGFTWHHLQYLIGLHRLGHQVTYFEHYGWPDSCYDPLGNMMTADPAYGLAYFSELLTHFDLPIRWCYLAQDGRAYGQPREALARDCRECDLYINLSNINWIPELEECRRRVLIDTDPVFTQIGAHGTGGPFSRYDVLFTYGENVHQAGCDMPTGGVTWQPTRPPVVLDLWPAERTRVSAPFTSVMKWSAYGTYAHQGRYYGQKDREFPPYLKLPLQVRRPMELAINAPGPIRRWLAEAGWRITDSRQVTRSPRSFQQYIAASRAEFSVAKHAHVCTNSGWFSHRSCCYLAAGRPVILQDTGFSEFLLCGEGLLTFRNPNEAIAAIRNVHADYNRHVRAARAMAGEYFTAERVLADLLERSFTGNGGLVNRNDGTSSVRVPKA